ncbi:hypothetical protein XH96_32845 [Bradyrhizobium sp. CCBAU 51765]|uniref:Uncharacterized protein n=1 Tax=Bradyrhizobium arachidis TaxID=858423 RepID=A0AAE7NM60_9BRAD|nr:hypothetical protein XH96_32845 [Bradyrhizobium sp. CCBAU 51765]QOZ66710.1 hypothetical protein WN72_10495 [Bradyrhizobium arachidis]
MVAQAPNLLLRKLLWIDRNLSFEESRRDRLIVVSFLMLLLPTSSVGRAVLRSGAVDACRVCQ